MAIKINIGNETYIIDRARANCYIITEIFSLCHGDSNGRCTSKNMISLFNRQRKYMAETLYGKKNLAHFNCAANAFVSLIVWSDKDHFECIAASYQFNSFFLKKIASILTLYSSIELQPKAKTCLLRRVYLIFDICQLSGSGESSTFLQLR